MTKRRYPVKKIYLLERKGYLGYDEVDAMVIQAPTELKARNEANKHCSDEGPLWRDKSEVKATKVAATNTLDDKVKLILRSFNAA